MQADLRGGNDAASLKLDEFGILGAKFEPNLRG
jgi:hypothetical protein